ncbi:MAG: hypothetical protein JSR66_09915 [Proteobacteria bacterium]|nr:hypothetical protein [Pseudomonadota bacterium]
MDQSDAYEELRAIFRQRVGQSFERARCCLLFARMARYDGNGVAVQEWLSSVRVFRDAAARWRRKARRMASVLLCFVWCLVGCAKAPPREFSAHFDVEPAGDGQTIVWSLQFSLDQYHVMLDSTADGTEHAKVRALIAAGLEMHHIVGCSAREKAVTKLGNGNIVFIGSCSLGARAVSAGSI